MKINYNDKFNLIIDEIKKLEKKPTILLHSCCGPCSSYVLECLKDYFDITVLYYNPNIYPEDEYIKRKDEQIKLIQKLNLFNVNYLDIDYLADDYKKEIVGLEDAPEGGKRCLKCFYLRLNKTANIASEKVFDYFGTTLTVSPHKNSQDINEIGFEIENKNKIKFLYSDFKKADGYKKSIELSKKYGLYRQNYCGCKYSINK